MKEGLHNHQERPKGKQVSTMMNSITPFPSVTVSSAIRGRHFLQKGRVSRNSTNFAYFVMALLSLALALAYQQGDFRSTYWIRSSSLLGTVPVTATPHATTALSVKNPRAGRPTMVSMAAGSSRTLIELAKPESEVSGKFLVEVTYIDENDEDTLIVLRRANIDTEQDRTKSVAKGGRIVYQRVARVLKNPIVATVVVGNIASIIGIVPPGIAGFLPAVSVLLGSKTKRAAPILQRLSSFRLGANRVRPPTLKTIILNLKVKLSNIISRLYEYRCKGSVLGDLLWFVDKGDVNSNQENIIIDKAIP